jgi:hypothetical protein
MGGQHQMDILNQQKNIHALLVLLIQLDEILH